MSNFFAQHFIRALGPQSAKVHEIFAMDLGWEVWAQIELGLEMKRAVNSGLAEFELGQFKREVMVYQGTEQRCDFLLEMGLAHVRHLHFVELKCLCGRETAASFIGRLRQDFEKVKTAEPERSWVGQARYVTGWVAAITVDRARDGKIDGKMNQLGLEQAIQWNCANVTQDGVIKVWTWSKLFYEKGQRV